MLRKKIKAKDKAAAPPALAHSEEQETNISPTWEHEQIRTQPN